MRIKSLIIVLFACQFWSGCEKEPIFKSRFVAESYARLPALTHIEGSFITKELISSHDHRAIWHYQFDIDSQNMLRMYEVYPKNKKRLIGNAIKVELSNRELIIKDALAYPPFQITDEMPPRILFITEDEFVAKVLNTDITYIFRRIK